MENEKARSIRLPQNLWQALDDDATRCRRSSQKQLEALLVTFYEMEDVEIDKPRLEMLGELFPQSKKKTMEIKAQTQKKKKKAG